MKNTTNTTKRSASKAKRDTMSHLNAACAQIVAAGGRAARADVGVSQHVMRRMVALGLVKATGEFIRNTDESGKTIAGRPAPVYRLTDKGRGRGKRLLAKSGS